MLGVGARLALAALVLSASAPGPAPARADPAGGPPPPATTGAPQAARADPLAEAFRAPGAPSRARFLAQARRLGHDPRLSLDACRAAGRGRVDCSTFECPGACQVVEVTLRFALLGGRVRLLSRRARHLGDTGQCGCCM